MKRIALVTAFALGATLIMAAPALAEPPSNDDFDAATVVEKVPFSTVTFTSEATKAEDDPNCFNGGRTVWYKLTASASREISASTIGSNYDTTLGVYTGARGALTEVVCSDDYEDYYELYKQSVASFEAVAGGTYYFMIGSLATGTRGTLKFNIDQAPGPPENDDIRRAVQIGRLPFSTQLDTRTATAAAGDIDCYGKANTVWYSFRPSKDQVLLADTGGSSYDTTLAVLTKSGGELNKVACVNNASGSRLARVRFEAKEGKQYFFRIGSAGDSGAGFLRFSLETPPPPLNMNVAIKPNGLVNTVTGVARVSGTIRCTRESRVYLYVDLRQSRDRRITQGSESKTVKCKAKRTSWSMTITGGRRAFLKGAAGATLKATSRERRSLRKSKSRIVQLGRCECSWGL